MIYRPAPDIKRTPESVFAYLQGNARLLDLTAKLVARSKLPTNRIDTGIAWLNKRLAQGRSNTDNLPDLFCVHVNALTFTK